MRPELRRIIGFKKPDSTPPVRNPYYEPQIAPTEGNEKTRVENQAQKLLERDLSTAVFNKYVDAMILLMGTNRFSLFGHHSSRGITFSEGDGNSRTIEFGRDEQGVRSVTTFFHKKEGVGHEFEVGNETLTLGVLAQEATDPDDQFADLILRYHGSSKNLKTEEVRSFIAGRNVDIPAVWESEHGLSLEETHEFLRRTFEHYKESGLSSSAQEKTG